MTETREERAEHRRPQPRKRLRLVLVAGLGGVAAIGLLIAFGRPDAEAPRFTVGSEGPRLPAPATGSLDKELARCRMLAAGREDARCRAAWERHRRRFFGEPTDELPENGAGGAR